MKERSLGAAYVEGQYLCNNLLVFNGKLTTSPEDEETILFGLRYTALA
jgi:hypothetical protein